MHASELALALWIGINCQACSNSCNLKLQRLITFDFVIKWLIYLLYHNSLRIFQSCQVCWMDFLLPKIVSTYELVLAYQTTKSTGKVLRLLYGFCFQCLFDYSCCLTQIVLNESYFKSNVKVQSFSYFLIMSLIMQELPCNELLNFVKLLCV